MNIQPDLPNHNDSHWYKLMEKKARAWNALGHELKFDFHGGYDHYHCTFSGQLTVSRGLLKVYGHREYVNVPNPAAVDRFSEILKIELALSQSTADVIKTFKKGFFGNMQLKTSGLTNTTETQDKIVGFSSSQLKDDFNELQLLNWPHFERLTLHNQTFSLLYHELFEQPEEMERVKSILIFLIEN